MGVRWGLGRTPRWQTAVQQRRPGWAPHSLLALRGQGRRIRWEPPTQRGRSQGVGVTAVPLLTRHRHRRGRPWAALMSPMGRGGRGPALGGRQLLQEREQQLPQQQWKRGQQPGRPVGAPQSTLTASAGARGSSWAGTECGRQRLRTRGWGWDRGWSWGPGRSGGLETTWAAMQVSGCWPQQQGTGQQRVVLLQALPAPSSPSCRPDSWRCQDPWTRQWHCRPLGQPRAHWQPERVQRVAWTVRHPPHSPLEQGRWRANHPHWWSWQSLGPAWGVCAHHWRLRPPLRPPLHPQG